MSVDIENVKSVHRNLTRYLSQFADCIKTEKSRSRLHTYVSGQISDLSRKSVEPIALAAGVAPRTRQEFLGLHRWNHEAVRQRVQEIVMRDRADANAMAPIDETSFVKKGSKTAGVQRQSCGTSARTGVQCPDITESKLQERQPIGMRRKMKETYRFPLAARSIALVLFAASIASLPFGIAHAQTDAKASKPFAYSGFSEPAYTGISVTSEYVPMSDGAKLAADIYRPADGPESKVFPVILEYLPYQRSRIDPRSGEASDSRNDADCKLFVSHGYVFVRADMRGTGASTGWVVDFMPRLCDDGKELVDWIATQPWCNGQVGMKGASYLGWAQTATASRKPKALKCIMPTAIPLDGYSGEVYPGGIYLRTFMQGFDEYMGLITRNCFVPDKGIRPTKPVVDEDGDGNLADEIPIYDPATGSFLTNGEPKYADGAPRKNIYYEATREHEKDYGYNAWASRAPFIDSKAPLGLTLYDLSPGAHVPGIMESGIPVYNIGAWFDGFTRGTFELYCTMAKTNPSKLLITPAYHEPEQGPFYAYFGEDVASIPNRYWREHLRFFDHYLKGIDNGIDSEPPICIYVMHGGGWRFEKEWPLARQVVTKQFFSADHALSSGGGPERADTYQPDLTHSSTYTETNGNRWLGIAVNWPSAPPIRTDKDKQCLAYTTEMLDANTEVTGHPIVHLFASSTSGDGDFFVYLEDVDEKGEALLVTEGQLRAGFAALKNNDRMILQGKRGIDVKPELPWHGFEEKDYNPHVFANGAVAELVIDLFPTSWVFRKGHQIRVSIACADYPTFPLHPLISPQNDPKAADNVIPTITLHCGGAHASRIELPVVSAR